MKMKIVKDSEGLRYKKTTVEKIYLLNGKEVRVYQHSFYDDMTGEFGDECIIDEQDEEKLSQKEKDFFDEHEEDIMQLENGEDFTIINYE